MGNSAWDIEVPAIADTRRNLSRGLFILKIGCCLAGVALLVMGARQMHRSACDSRSHLYAFFGSDTLTCAAFYQEVFVDGRPARSFYFPTTTVLFPDFGIYLMARTITGSTAPAMVLASCILFALQLAGCYFVMRLATPPERRWPQTTILLGMGAIFLLVNARSGLENPFFRLPMILTYHGGSLVCVLFAAALLLYLLHAPDWRRQHRLALSGLFLLTALGMLSDRLMLIHLVVPASGSMVLMRFLLGGPANGWPWRRIGCLIAVLGAGAFCGQQLLCAFQAQWQDVVSNYPYTLHHAWESLRLLAGKWHERLLAYDGLHWLATFSAAACAIVVAWQVLRRCRTRTPLVLSAVQRGLLLCAVFYLALTVSGVAAVCYSGLVYNPPYMVDFSWGGAARYFLPVLFLPFFLIGLWLVPLDGARSRRLPSAAAFGVLVLAGACHEQSVQTPRANDQAVWRYYPPFVAELDAIAAEHDLHCGLAAYWQADVAAYLSHRDLRVHQIIADGGAPTKMTSFHWLSSSRCYFDAPSGAAGPPRYQFILVNERPNIPTPSRAELRERFGEPAAALPCGPYYVFVYNRDKDAGFQDIVSQEASMKRGQFQSKLGETIRFEASSLPSAILGPTPSDQRTAVAGCVPAGVLCSGPTLPLREAGTYRFKVVTSSPEEESSPGRWEALLINPKFGSSSLVAAGEIQPGELREGVGQVSISNRHRGRAIEFRVHYGGSGTLQMHYLEVKRIR
jgi:hypothetical protein